MNLSKHLISGITAGAIVAAVGFAYAQTTEGTATPTAPESSQAQPNSMTPTEPTAMPSTPTPTATPTPPSDSTDSSTTEPAPKADRN